MATMALTLYHFWASLYLKQQPVAKIEQSLSAIQSITVICKAMSQPLKALYSAVECTLYAKTPAA